MLDRLKSIPLKYSVTLKIFPIVINTDAIKKEKDSLSRRILELSDGFNTIDDIAKELNVPKMRVLEKIGELRRKRKLDFNIYALLIFRGGEFMMQFLKRKKAEPANLSKFLLISLIKKLLELRYDFEDVAEFLEDLE